MLFSFAANLATICFCKQWNGFAARRVLITAQFFFVAQKVFNLRRSDMTRTSERTSSVVLNCDFLLLRRYVYTRLLGSERAFARMYVSEEGRISPDASKHEEEGGGDVYRGRFFFFPPPHSTMTAKYSSVYIR